MQPSIWQAHINDKQPVQLQLFENDDDARITLYRFARILYAESGASSLAAVEALASMANNLRKKRRLSGEATHSLGEGWSDIVNDDKIFESLVRDSTRQQDLFVDSGRLDFQMCLRTARRAISGILPDTVMGATRFHHSTELPEWATGEGYISEIDELFFYK